MSEISFRCAKESILLQLTELQVLAEIKQILSEFWLPPHEMSMQIRKIVDLLLEGMPLEIVVSGETRNVSLYVISTNEVLVFTPFSTIENNVLLQEVYSTTSLPQKCVWYIFPADALLLRRLSFPKVLLVNPCVLEHFPIPRLCLSIGSLASYLRKYQKADVHLIDMQVGSTVEDILEEVRSFRPVLFGLSISYGQKHLALSILKHIYQAKAEGFIDPLVVLGNILPASFPQEYTELYPDLIIVCGEGELTIIGLIEYLQGVRKLSSIPGIAYRDLSGKIQRTLNISVPMETIPLPALDTIRDIARCRGAITVELSRGCQWNGCAFCPREHKSSHWKTFPTSQTMERNWSSMRTNQIQTWGDTKSTL
jgi:hypothetical protein